MTNQKEKNLGRDFDKITLKYDLLRINVANCKRETLTDTLSIRFFVWSEATLPLPGGDWWVGQTQGACRNRQATVRKKQASLTAFFVPAEGKISEPFLRDLELIVKLKI